jgi:hypothetical protein
MDYLFEVKRMTSLPYEWDDNVWLSITVEVDFDVITYEREVYTSLQLLSDIGGLSGILMTIAAALMVLWNYQSFDNYLVSRLFRIRKPEEEVAKRSNYFNQSQYITLSKYPKFGELVRKCCPSFMCCCR